MARQSVAKHSKSGSARPAEAERAPRPTATTKANPDLQANADNKAMVRPANIAERGLELAGDRLWKTFRRRPYLGAVLAGGIGLGMASVIGVAELAVAVGTGYAAFQVLKNRVSPGKAIREAFQFDEELVD
jgi:hypothetical protein